MQKALDLLRTLGWGLIDFIYSLIDSLFNILKEINAFDIVDSLSNEGVFVKFYGNIIVIAITVLALFSVWSFIKKILDPEESLSIEQIVREIFKCGLLILMSTFIFAQSNNLSMNLSGFASSAFKSDNITIGDNMVSQYVTHSESYKTSDDYQKEDISKYIINDNFKNKEMYNDKFVTGKKWVVVDKKDYKYSVNWIMAIIVGGFFLYALVFSGMMLARRQIEFLFLFCISPIVFATSVGNKQRRSAVYELLVSLILQAAVVMLIIGLTALLMKSIQGTVFFADSAVNDTILKSILYIGCGTFLLTGSQVANKFIGSNVSANSGREHLMSMMGYGNMVKTGAIVGGVAGAGAGLVGLGAVTGTAGRLGGNHITSKIGTSIGNYGKKISGSHEAGSLQSKIGNVISSFGTGMAKHTPSQLSKSIRGAGYNRLSNAVHMLNPIKIPYFNRRQNRGGN